MKKISKILIVVLVLVVVLACAGLFYLSYTEYTPEDGAQIDVFGSPTIEVQPGDKLKIMTYNIGSGISNGAAQNASEGGKSTKSDADSINSDLNSAIEMCTGQIAHVNMFQQVDIGSSRSCGIDEASLISNGIYGRASAFLADYKCDFAPFPLGSATGKVESGMLTLTRFNVDSAQCKTITNGTGWPARTWSRKPTLLVEKVKLGDSTKELVLINLDLEKYDDGTVRQAQYKELCEFMQLEFAKGNYVIAGGSFNAALPSVAKDKYTDEAEGVYTPMTFSTELLTGGWKYCTDDTTPTMRLLNTNYTTDSLVYVTDGFITSPNTIVESVETIDNDFMYSSHNPVVIEVTLVK